MLHSLQANVSHNMKAPLNAISHCADMLLDVAGIPPQCVYLVDPIRYASNILTCHVNDLLDFNLILKGQFEKRISKVDPKEVIHQIVQIVKM